MVDYLISDQIRQIWSNLELQIITILGFILINSLNSFLKSTHYLSLVSSHRWLQNQSYSSHELD